MKVIYFAPRFPLPAIGGDRLLTERYLREFGPRWELHFIGFAEGHAVDPEKIAELEASCPLASTTVLPLGLSRVTNALLGAARGWPLQAGYYYDPRMEAELRRLVARVNPDAVIFQTVRLQPYFDAAGAATRAIHFVDALSMNYQRSRGFARDPLTRMLYAYEARGLVRLEREALRSSQVAHVVSTADAEYLRGLRDRHSAPVHIVPLGVDTDFFSYRPMAPEPRFRIALLGRMATRANADAAVWFAKELLPRLCERMGRRVELVVAGANPSRRVRRLQSPSVTVTGEVPDIRPFVWESDLTVAPMRIATGIQTKVLQSLSMGRPVVATTACADGLGAAVEGVYTAADGPGMVERIAEIYSAYPEVRAAMPRAREAFARRFAWESVLGGFAETIERRTPSSHASEATEQGRRNELNRASS